MSSRNRRTAIAIFAVHRLYVAATGAMIVHRLPQTAGMGCGSRNRHGHRDKRARNQQHKQQSGGQAIHDWFGRSGLDSFLTGPLATSIGDKKPTRKYSTVTVVSGHVGGRTPSCAQQSKAPRSLW